MSNFFSKIFHKKKRILPHFERVKLDKKKLLLNNLLGGVAWGIGSVTGATTILVILGLTITITKSIPFVGDIVTIGLRQIEGAKQTASFLTQTGTDSSVSSETALKFLVDSNQNSYALTQFIELNATMYNVSFEPVQSFFDTCAEQLEIYLDDRLVYESIGRCKIGPGVIESFGEKNRTLYLDGSKLSIGEHQIRLVSDGVISNTVSLVIHEPSERIDCVRYDASISPVCAQLTVSGQNISNLEECELINSKYSSVPGLVAVSMSDGNCSDDTSVEFIFNVPKTEEEQWGQVLREIGRGMPVIVKSGVQDVYRLEL